MSETSPTPLPDPLDVTSWEAAASDTIISDGEIPVTDAPPAGGDLTCESCGKTFFHSGRGRKPKRCLECREAKTAPGTIRTKTTRGARTKAEKEADALAAQIKRGMVLSALGISQWDSFDGMAILAGSDGFSTASGKVLAKNEKLRVLLSSSDGGGYVALIMWALVILVPICAHHGLIPGELTRDGKKVPIKDVIETLPETLIKMQKRMANAEADLAAKIAEAANA